MKLKQKKKKNYLRQKNKTTITYSLFTRLNAARDADVRPSPINYVLK